MEIIPVEHALVIDGIEYKYVKPHPYMFKCHLYDDRNGNGTVQNDFIFDGRRWFKEFDTNQYIAPPDDMIMRIKIKQMKDKIQCDKLKTIIDGCDDVKKIKKVKQKNNFGL